MALSNTQKPSGVSADTNSLPSCPGLICDATMPVSSYATPATIAAPQPRPSERARRYMNQPASTKCSAMAYVMARSVGMSQRSHADG